MDAFTNKTASNSFRFITANENSDRNHTTSYTEFFFQNGEKGGPMATYLVTASKRRNFQLQMNTTVTRVLRKGGTVTGVEVESTGSGGLIGTLKVTPGSGRVILSAGVFNTFKILVRSGIGPVAEVQRLANTSTEAAKLPPKKDWLDLPAGYNLDDGPNFYLAVRVPNVEIYPWLNLWNSKAENPDIKLYLETRSGPLTELQATIGPVSWDTVTGKDGRKRVVQWDATSGCNALLPDDGELS
jgi:cellobiose dehydrogenase (acceptor)